MDQDFDFDLGIELENQISLPTNTFSDDPNFKDYSIRDIDNHNRATTQSTNKRNKLVSLFNNEADFIDDPFAELDVDYLQTSSEYFKSKNTSFSDYDENDEVLNAKINSFSNNKTNNKLIDNNLFIINKNKNTSQENRLIQNSDPFYDSSNIFALNGIKGAQANLSPIPQNFSSVKESSNSLLSNKCAVDKALKSVNELRNLFFKKIKKISLLLKILK